MHLLYSHNIDDSSYLLIPIWALYYVATLFNVCLKIGQNFWRFGDYLKFYLWCSNSDDTIVFRVPEYPWWRNCMSIERVVRPKSTNVGITRFSGDYSRWAPCWLDFSGTVGDIAVIFRIPHRNTEMNYGGDF